MKSKEKGNSKIKKYAKIHGPNDFELTDTPQSTLYITDEFLKTVKKGDIFEITNKIFVSLHYLSVQFLFQQLKGGFRFTILSERKRFYNVWEFMKNLEKNF